MALHVKNPSFKPKPPTRVSGLSGSASAPGGGGLDSPFGRTPTFLRPLEEEEHATVQELVKGVLQIFASTVEKNWKQPWSKSPPSSCTGTGFIISVKDRLIVTNAHCTTDAMTLQVRKDGDFDKFEARVLACSHQADLSLITVDKDAFWEGAIELPLGETPRLQQHVDVVGYPMGGDGISVTSGVVSRVDWGMYTHGATSNLIVTVDAAINGGNSGGPAICDGRVVGVAFQGLSTADNIGYIIPATVLRTVLEDYRQNGERLIGFADLCCTVSMLENPAKRAWLGMPEGLSGVHVRSVHNLSALKGQLREGDVITEVDGHKISNDGRVRYGAGSPMDFRVFITLKLVGAPLRLALFRAGARVDVATTAEGELELVPSTWFKDTQYVFFAGLVFLPMAAGVKETYYHTQVLYEADGRKHVHPAQQVVGLGTILPHSCTLGYSMRQFSVEPLLKVNGEAVMCLGDVLRLTEAAEGAFIVFEFNKANKLVLSLPEAREATKALMKDHGIAQAASADVAAAAALGPLAPSPAAAAGAAVGGAGSTA